MQDLEKEYGTQTGSANCFDRCILAWKILRCLEHGSLFSRPLNCTPESLGGGEPAIHTLESEGRGSPEQVSSRSCPLWGGVGLGRQSGFRVPLRCGRQHASLLCFVWQRGTRLPSNPAAGKAQTSVLSSMQDGILFIIPNKEEDDLMCVRRTFYICMRKRHPLFPNKHVPCISCCFTFHLSFRWWNEPSSLIS